MKVHLIKKQTINDYVRKHSNSHLYFESWFNKLKHVDWREPNDIIQTYNDADILGQGTKRVVFNIGGKNFRMICKHQFGKSRVHLFVKWIGTHAEYTKLCNRNKQYSISQF